jgi:uroporphyrinogen-III synthase
MTQYTILSTKKIQPSLKEEMVQKGIEVLEKEFISIRLLVSMRKYEEIWPWIITTSDTAIVFTSQHAVATIDKLLHGGDAFYIPDQWQAFCLNGATKELTIQMLSEEQIIDTAPNATELASKIIAHGQFKQVVFFCGNQRREELPHLLKAAGIDVVEIIVYETIETPGLITNDLDAVLFFSPSAVKSFFTLNTLKKDTACFAIGATTAEAISHYTDNRVITSESPTQEMMMTSISLYFRNIDQYK